MSPKTTLDYAQKNPFDADDEGEARAAEDWAHAAARGVIADLRDRRGIKHGFVEIEHEDRIEIVQSLAAIIRAALDSAKK